MNENQQADYLYLECHVTFEPVFGDDLARLSGIAERNGFKVADLLMQKRLTDTAERSKYDTFMTGHGEDMADLVARTVSLVYEAKVPPQYSPRKYRLAGAVRFVSVCTSASKSASGQPRRFSCPVASA